MPGCWIGFPGGRGGKLSSGFPNRVEVPFTPLTESVLVSPGGYWLRAQVSLSCTINPAGERARLGVRYADPQDTPTQVMQLPGWQTGPDYVSEAYTDLAGGSLEVTLDIVPGAPTDAALLAYWIAPGAALAVQCGIIGCRFWPA